MITKEHYNENTIKDLYVKVSRVLAESKSNNLEVILTLMNVIAETCIQSEMIFEEFESINDAIVKCLEKNWPIG